MCFLRLALSCCWSVSRVSWHVAAICSFLVSYVTVFGNTSSPILMPMDSWAFFLVRAWLLSMLVLWTFWFVSSRVYLRSTSVGLMQRGTFEPKNQGKVRFPSSCVGFQSRQQRKGSGCSVSSPVLGVVSLLNSPHSDGQTVGLRLVKYVILRCVTRLSPCSCCLSLGHLCHVVSPSLFTGLFSSRGPLRRKTPHPVIYFSWLFY